jgi:peptidoglycan/LPS O-acetylase OafA/YrhL
MKTMIVPILTLVLIGALFAASTSSVWRWRVWTALKIVLIGLFFVGVIYSFINPQWHPWDSSNPPIGTRFLH